MTDFIQKVVTVLISQVNFVLFLFLLFQFTLLDKPSMSLNNFDHPIRNFSAAFPAFRAASVCYK